MCIISQSLHFLMVIVDNLQTCHYASVVQAFVWMEYISIHIFIIFIFVFVLWKWIIIIQSITFIYDLIEHYYLIGNLESKILIKSFVQTFIEFIEFKIL